MYRKKKKLDSDEQLVPSTGNSRRRFMKHAGIGLAAAGTLPLLVGCDDDLPGGGGFNDLFDTVSLGEGDVGVLNFAYALEQLEAAFYTQVLLGSYFKNAPAEEQQILRDLELHERAHRDFFKAAIGSVATPIPQLGLDFSAIDFSNRESVLSAAKTFEDLGVAAYNGAGKLLSNPDFLLVAGKIVSVEARHAAAIRSILDADVTSFAGDDIIDSNGLDRALPPAEVLAAADPFFVNPIDASGLPG
ncbi:MAG: ferritin-like domain-containing protein [Bacteroidota bacterium]